MLGHRLGISRHQLEFGCLEEKISSDNLVRVIDAFVSVLDMNALGFAHAKPEKMGAPAYDPSLFLRIYIYGYLNGVRSSRKLEAECVRNVEMQWLCGKQVPCYHTISTFRSCKKSQKDKKTGKTLEINHQKALKEVFRTFNRFLAGEDLFGKETVATDGTKIRAQNAKKKNYTESKLSKKIEHVEANIAQYLSDLDTYDKAESLTDGEKALQTYAKTRLEELQKWGSKYKSFQTELKARQKADPEVTQISTTDPDARSLVVNNLGHTEVSYNVVTAVDDKHNLVAHFFTDNVKDIGLLSDSLIATKVELDHDFAPNLYENNANPSEPIDLQSLLKSETKLNGLADKGFHAATQLHECAENGIVTYVAVPEHAHSGKDKDFTIDHFVYNEKDDTFTCPNQQTLTCNGQFYERKDRRGQFVQRFKRYSMSPKTCAECPFASKCLAKTAIKNRVSRQLERAEFQQAATENKQRVQSLEGKTIYKRRQAIVEHPFGIIKRQWGCDFTLLKGLQKVNAEFAIVFTCYNLRRAMSILSVKTLLERLHAFKNALFACADSFCTLKNTLKTVFCPQDAFDTRKYVFLIFFGKAKLALK